MITIAEDSVTGAKWEVNINPDSTRMKLIRLLHTLRPANSDEDSKKFVLFVSVEDSIRIITEGELGETSDKLVLKGGLNSVFPRFYGHTTIWNSSKTKIQHLNDLNRDELLAVIQNQKYFIELEKNLYVLEMKLNVEHEIAMQEFRKNKCNA